VSTIHTACGGPHTPLAAALTRCLWRTTVRRSPVCGGPHTLLVADHSPPLSRLRRSSHIACGGPHTLLAAALTHCLRRSSHIACGGPQSAALPFAAVLTHCLRRTTVRRSPVCGGPHTLLAADNSPPLSRLRRSSHIACGGPQSAALPPDHTLPGKQKARPRSSRPYCRFVVATLVASSLATLPPR